MLNLGKFFSIGLIICLALAGVALAGADDADKLTPNERGWDAKYNGLVSAIGKDSLELTVPEIDYIGNYGGSLDTAVSQIGTARKRLLINQATTMANNLTIPATLQLGISRKGQINIPTTKTLTINGGLEAGLYQIFSCAGTGSVAGLAQVYPEWFGTVGDGTTDDTAALNKAFAAGSHIVFQPGKTYYAPTLAAITQNNLIIKLDGATLKTGGLSVTGDNTVVDLGGGTLDGCLKYATIATLVPVGSKAITVTDASAFTTADTLQSSYGLSSDHTHVHVDGAFSSAIDSIDGNTINVHDAVFAIGPCSGLPAGSKVGNWHWGRTVSLSGANCRLQNGRIINSRGAVFYLNGCTKAMVENLTISDAGLQGGFINNSTEVIFNNVHFGNILDAAKSTLAVDGASDVVINNSTFKPYNYDNLILIGYDSNTNIRVILNNCTLDAIGGCEAPYDGNGQLASIEHGHMNNLEFNHCTIKNFRFGVYPALGATGFTADRIVFNDCDVDTGKALYKFDTTAKIPKQLQCTNSHFKRLTDFFGGVGDFANCVFDACTFDNASAFSGRVINCKFLTCTGIRFTSTAYQDGNYFKDTQIGIYPFYNPLGVLNGGLVLIDNINFPGTVSNVVATADGDTTRLRFQSVKGSQPWRVWHLGGSFFHSYEITCFQSYPKNLIGDDWLIPAYSLIHFLGDGSTKYVNKSKATKLAVAATASEVTITVADATGFANGEVINILCDDNRVHSTTINGAPAGNVVTLTNVMPYAAAIGKGVCAYTVAP
ncbi:MAG: right-handed parallel beta-helix repeat-containing protein [Deltaproteobacteria bacterium]|nr:right-handed parallel beta-helix repeat-containing protein [Deltaproteobacteria bacterium]